MATKAGKKKKRAPLRRAKGWGSEVPAIAGRLLVTLLVVALLGLMFSALQGIPMAWLRIALSLVIAAGLLLFFYNEGINKGCADAMNSRQMARLERAGRTIEPREEASCYHPLKALCGCAAVFALPIALAAFLGATAQDYTYELQDLPTWLTGSYGSRQDVIAPLAAYTQTAGASLKDWIRVLVRLFELLFINLFGDPQRMSATIDRLSPLMLALYPAAYMIGYLRGPASTAKLESQNKKAKKAAVRKQKKSNLASELVGDTRAPHYGQRRDADKPRRKELV